MTSTQTHSTNTQDESERRERERQRSQGSQGSNQGGRNQRDDDDDRDESTRSQQERQRSEQREQNERERSQQERDERHDQLERSSQDEEQYRLRELREARSMAEDRTIDRQNARRYMEFADRRGSQAARAVVRSTNEAFTSLIPPVFIRPGAILRSWFDLMSMNLDLQRAMWDEATQVWREDTQRAARSARNDERVDIDREWEQERERIGR